MNQILEKTKAKILSEMGTPNNDWNDWTTKRYNSVKELKNFPTDSSQLRNLGVDHKAKILRLHLKHAFPETKFSVRIEYYSGGSAIRCHWKGGGKYPYGAYAISKIYSDSGKTDIQSDYFDVDNYVDMYDIRENKPRSDPQAIAENRANRLQQWLINSIDFINYDDRINWSVICSRDMLENKFIPFVGMTTEHIQTYKAIFEQFKNQEALEN